MTSINPINVNTNSVGTNYIYGQNAKNAKNKNVEEKAPQAQAEQKAVNPDSVFDYMANSASTLVASASAKSGVTSIDPSKYVDAASRARIESFVGGFQDKVADGLQSFNKEFPGSTMSDSSKMTVVLKQINNNMN